MRLLGILLVMVACGESVPGANVPVDVTPTEREGGSVSKAVPRPTADARLPSDKSDQSVCASRADGFGPVALDDAEAAGRRGKNTQKFGDTPSTQAKPIEVCGVHGEQAWLMRVKCSDGSRAFDNRDQVRLARVGSTGGGGRCDSMIDHYAVTCPEDLYDVFLDMYMCGPGEHFL